MKIFNRFSFFICCISFCPVLLMAQEKSSLPATPSENNSPVTDSIAKQRDSAIHTHDLSSGSKQKSYLKAGLSYMSDNVYLGRKDSVALPYISPMLGYYFKSGLFVESSVGYLASQGRIDVVSFDGGYSFTAGSYEGEASVAKYFYSSQSTSVRSEVKSSVSYFNGYDFGIIMPTVGVNLNFGNKTDVAGQFGLEHTFYALTEKLDITPTFTANASTQNYYNDYYKKRRYTIKRKGKKPVSGIASVSGTVLDASRFKVLDYEISVPVNYQIGKFTFNLLPVYAIPIHPAQVQITTVLANNISSTKINSEKIGNNFFGTIGVSYRFGK